MISFSFFLVQIKSSIPFGIFSSFIKKSMRKEFNETKSTLYPYKLNDGLDAFVARYLPFHTLDINAGVKYLGFYLKPKIYVEND
jgi:hypothetical protein